METITQNRPRFSSDTSFLNSNENSSKQSLLWHLALHNKFSLQDKELLQTLTPNNCSLFIIKENNFVFKSDCLDERISSIKSEINYAYDASYVQQIESIDNGLLRVLTIPIDKQILVGLISSTNMASSLNIEDSFLHKVYIAQMEYNQILKTADDMHNTLDHSEPILVINRSDNQIITCNESFQSFINLSKHEIIESNLRELQNKYPKTSNRKVVIKNCTIGEINCSKVQYTLKQTDKIQSDILTEELKLHTETLLKFYHDVQSSKTINKEFIDTKIKEIQNCYQSILKLEKR